MCRNCHTQVEISSFLTCTFVIGLVEFLTCTLTLHQLNPSSRFAMGSGVLGNNSKLMTINSVQNFVILREFNVKLNFQKAPRIREVVWLAPLIGWIKINSDGAAHGAPGFAGGGIIFRDFNGAMGGFATIFGIKDSLFAELQATIMAIEKGYVPWRLANKWHRC
ncbi:hypothetical protein Lal_00012077 [Lupinus albus]|nr:hypothetical protein Lal_00012077 [Lupinus albus]